MNKKAILVVSFGTIYLDALEKSISATENRFRTAFPDYEVRRAFTSDAVIEKLTEKSNLSVDNVSCALKKLIADGFNEVYLQPLYLTADKTYTHIRDCISRLMHSSNKTFARISMGRPLLLSLGCKNHPDDYRLTIDALHTQLNDLGGEKSVVFMCNGSQQLEYSALQLKLNDAGIDNAFIYTAEGYPSLQDVIRRLRERRATDVVLAPFLLVASEHVLDYMTNEREESALSQLTAAGFRVTVHRSGLGENPAIQDLFIQHLTDAIQSSKRNHGTRKETRCFAGLSQQTNATAQRLRAAAHD